MTGLASPLRALVVDDESLARARMRTLLGDCHTPSVQWAGEASNASSVSAWYWVGTQTLATS